MNPLIAGSIGVLVAVLFFGTYAVPVKKYPTGDGVVFQWVECCGILLVGMIIQVINGAPYVFEPLAMVGGALWCLGNATVIPVVDRIGLGLGILIWGGFNLVIGWSVGHFVFKETVNHPILNYIGVALALVSIGLYLPIEATVQKVQSEEEEEEERASLINADVEDVSVEANQSKSIRNKVVGIVLSIVAGALYASNVIPVSYLQKEEKYQGNHYLLAFCLSHFAGIFAMSTVIVIVYGLWKRNKPEFFPQSILPGLAAGIMWGIAQAGLFVANSDLGLSVAFPIASTGPGVIASLWGVLAFKEIRGFRNFAWLGTAFFVTISGIACITLSKQ